MTLKDYPGYQILILLVKENKFAQKALQVIVVYWLKNGLSIKCKDKWHEWTSLKLKADSMES